MSLVKVNLVMSEAMEALALEPLKRLFMQRKQENYKQATGEYSSRLRQLYFAQVGRRLQAKRRFKLTLESAQLRLEVTDKHPEQLNGITIQRSSLPNAEPNDLVQLISCNESTNGQVIASGHVQSVTSSELRIKLSKALVLREKVPENEATKGVEKVVGQEQEQEQEQSSEDEKGEATKAEDNNIDEAEAESESPPEPKIERIIDFKIKFELLPLGEIVHQQSSFDLQIQEQHRLVDNMLIRFNDLKCNQSIHKNLLGLYDERSDLIHEHARVMTFDELPAKIKGQQLLAVEQSIKRRVSLIEGPAGSGKTLVAAHLAANMARLKRAKVLVCSPIWTNVSKLAEMIGLVDGVQVVKLPVNWHPHLKHKAAARVNKKAEDNNIEDGEDCSTTKTDDSSSNRLDFDKLVDGEIFLQAWNRSKETLHNHDDLLHAHAYRMVTSCSTHRRREVEAKIIGRANVVCCTNLQAAALHSLASPVEFDMLILDDVQVTSELDCLAPIMTRGIKQVTFLSDMRRRIRLARSSKLSTRMSNGIATQQANGNSTTTQNGHMNNNDNSSTLLRNNRQTSSLRRKPSSLSLSGGSSSRRGGSTRRKASRPASQVFTSGEARNSMSLIESVAPDQLPGGLYERLLAIGLPTVDFRFQFRMHQTLSNFTNHHFYLGRLKDDPEANSKMQDEIETRLLIEDKHFNWLPNRKYLTALYAMSMVAPSTSSSSSSNTLDLTKLMIEKLDYIIMKLTGSAGENIQESRIGVIFNRPVNPEVEWMKKLFSSSASKIKHGTISDFIGQERDFIVLVALPAAAENSADAAHQLEAQSCQQMSALNSEIPFDFKANDSALNCALTRARLGMFLIASIAEDALNLSNGEHDEQIAPLQTNSDICIGWNDMISYYNESGLTVTH